MGVVPFCAAIALMVAVVIGGLGFVAKFVGDDTEVDVDVEPGAG